MIRILRLSFCALVYVSLVIVVLLWERSYFYADYLYFHTPGYGQPSTIALGAVQRGGIVQLDFLENSGIPTQGATFSDGSSTHATGRWYWGSTRRRSGDADWELEELPYAMSRGGVGWRRPDWAFLGIGYGTATYSYQGLFTSALPAPGVCHFVKIPHWLLALILLIWPALQLRGRYRRQRRQKLGRCNVCGYDLRATPDRCPECGQETPGLAARARTRGDANVTRTLN